MPTVPEEGNAHHSSSSSSVPAIRARLEKANEPLPPLAVGQEPFFIAQARIDAANDELKRHARADISALLAALDAKDAQIAELQERTDQEIAMYRRALGEDSEELRAEVTRRREAFRAVLLRAESAESQLTEARARLERAKQQAHAIEVLLRDASVGPCPLPEGVRLLLNRAEAADALAAQLRLLVDAGKQDAEILDEIQDSGRTVREELAALKALRGSLTAQAEATATEIIDRLYPAGTRSEWRKAIVDALAAGTTKL